MIHITPETWDIQYKFILPGSDGPFLLSGNRGTSSMINLSIFKKFSVCLMQNV